MIATKSQILWTLEKLSERSLKTINDLKNAHKNNEQWSTPDKMAYENSLKNISVLNSTKNNYK